MDLSASIGWIVAAAFGIGALHALEPGHGKSIMGAYLVASRGGVQHALLLGLVVAITHTLIVFILAFGALALANRFATDAISFWLELISAVLVLGVGLWMMANAFGWRRRREELSHRPSDVVETDGAVHSHSHPHEHNHVAGGHVPGHGHGQSHTHEHDHPHTHEHVHAQTHEHGPAHAHPHDHGHTHANVAQFSHHGHTHEVRLPEGKDPLGIWTLVAVGASGGLVPCPAALTALLAAVNLGRPATGIAVVAAMSLGIAATLMAIGVVFVQAGRWASSMFGSRGLTIYVPRLSAALITVLGCVLLGRTVLGHAH